MISSFARANRLFSFSWLFALLFLCVTSSRFILFLICEDSNRCTAIASKVIVKSGKCDVGANKALLHHGQHVRGSLAVEMHKATALRCLFYLS